MMLAASLRRIARFSGALSFRVRQRSSSKTTSRIQCSWFSMLQRARTIASNRFDDAGAGLLGQETGPQEWSGYPSILLQKSPSGPCEMEFCNNRIGAWAQAL